MTFEKTEHLRAVPLRDARVLVVEDEYYIADDIRRALAAAGARVIGPVSTVEKAKELLADAGFDCALVDLNLGGESAIPIADRLREAGKPFALATGYGKEVVPERLKDVPRIEKPFDPPAVVALIKQLRSRGSDVRSGSDYPKQPQDEDQDEKPA